MNNCLACGSSGLNQILNFGHQAAANLLPKEPDAPVRKELLALDYCDTCGHAQQSFFYPPQDLFCHYLYQSGTSKTLQEYFKWLSKGLSKGRGNDGITLELASNDGSFLKALAAEGLSAVGVEPAENLIKISKENGHEVIHGFWPMQLERKFDSIVAMNVVAHTPDPYNFMLGVASHLTDDGVAYIQASQVDMFENYEFDTLYHEHYSFYSPSSMDCLAKRAGIKFSRFIKTDIHGGSLLGIFGNNESKVVAASKALQDGKFFIAEMDASKRPQQDTAQRFSGKAIQTCNTLKHICSLASLSGYQVILVGAAAKAITVLQASDIKVDMVIDEAPLKIGLFVPGTNLQIHSFQKISEVSSPALFVIGAWNFYNEIKNKLAAARNNQSDLVGSYFPSFQVEKL